MNKKSKILVCGSVVIDTLFDIRGNIRDCINITEGKLGAQNFSFSSIEKKEYPGGCAGNICYGLAILGENPLMASIVGKDFESKFKKYYNDLGINSRLYTDKEGYTATFYGMTDANKEQIGVFQGNALTKNNEKILLRDLISQKEFQNVTVAIVAPQSAKATIQKLEEIKKIGKGKVFTIFDPGQELIPSFGNKPKELKKVLSLSKMVILNEVETKQLEKILDVNKKEFFSFGIDYLIETLGANGSILYTQNNNKIVQVKKVSKVIDPVGAGDAFRAGLIYGIANNLKIEDAMKIGSILGAESVKHAGGQAYSLPKSFKKA